MTLRSKAELNTDYADGGAAKNITPLKHRNFVDTAFPAFTTLTSGATVTWATAGAPINKAKLTLGTNATLSITGAVDGSEGYLEVTQDGTGGRTFTLPAGTVVGATTSINTTASKMTAIAWSYNGSAFTFVLSQQA